ncbi:5'-methylthioadenosine/adenosylhomocysteine nucleosidase [Leuconostoc gelidum subsp. gasicomitatum]|uniref:5'-methylthioadenosine/adenosylhomocysteine nucleosidase n=1 Tax=Leuconostoc gasicomitatum TaxID=115778 RepID=UPI001CC6F105|nr:5'-methylthioadenosine/adenosylhomocysteine nucleosidase [Leuconostoc gasicomitatum]MBZ5961333.1 5'-methylthioadenosine/adenosylhomocysteine nucleosidase [Leuconostoc gasicomitatum]MBZ5994881.1 5'-methylthioadenosine/adenosylhomocysteine nucleosidase [Leuconostoc gasicomitatum]
MKIGIITPMAEEKITLIAALENTATKHHGGTEITTGQYHGHEVVLTESGIGKVAAASATTVLIDNFQPDLVVNTGSAGALDPDLKIGDEVVGTHVAYSDVDVTVFGYDFGQVPNRPLYYEADKQVVREFSQLAAVKTGLIVSGDQFVQDEAKQRILTHFPEAMLAEMEAAAVAQVAYQFKTPFIVLRGVSDLANGDSGIVFDDYVVEAGKVSAKLLLSYLDSKA